MTLTVVDVSNPACLAAEISNGRTVWRLTFDIDDGVIWHETRLPSGGWSHPGRVVRVERFGPTPQPGDGRAQQRITWNAWVAAYVAGLAEILEEDEHDAD